MGFRGLGFRGLGFESPMFQLKGQDLGSVGLGAFRFLNPKP